MGSFGSALANDAAAKPFRAEDYAELRKQLRAFHPDECHGKCKDPAFDVSDQAIRADLRAYAAEHPRSRARRGRKRPCTPRSAGRTR